MEFDAGMQGMNPQRDGGKPLGNRSGRARTSPGCFFRGHHRALETVERRGVEASIILLFIFWGFSLFHNFFCCFYEYGCVCVWTLVPLVSLFPNFWIAFHIKVNVWHCSLGFLFLYFYKSEELSRVFPSPSFQKIDS